MLNLTLKCVQCKFAKFLIDVPNAFSVVLDRYSERNLIATFVKWKTAK